MVTHKLQQHAATQLDGNRTNGVRIRGSGEQGKEAVSDNCG
jgi:hypothetical protein